jgi:hypothetical protein
VRLGDAGLGKLALSVGIKDGKDFAAGFVVNDKGEVALNSRLEIRKAGGVAKPPVRLERTDGLNIVIGDTNTGADRLAVGPEVSGTFEPKLTVGVDGTATIAGNANVGGNAKVAGTAAIVGATTVGAGGSSALHVRHIEGKNWQNDDPDHLFLNWISGRNVVLGQVSKRSSLFVAGDAVVGAGNDGFLATRHLRGKKHTDDTPDTLFVNYGTGTNVVVGAPGGTKSSLQVSGDVIAGASGDAALITRHLRGKKHTDDTPDDLFINFFTGKTTRIAGEAVVGSGGNGSLHTRHVDGKSHLNDGPGDLHLNWGTGTNVVIGNPTTAANLIVHGAIVVGGPENTDPLSLERFNVGDDQTDLRIVIGDNTGAGDRLVVGPRPSGSTQVIECLAVRNDGEVATSGNLRVGGARTHLQGTDAGHEHRIFVGTEPQPAVILKDGPLAKEFFVKSPWAKHFSMDHPLDPDNRDLVHSTLEGPEIAVVYRGEGRLEDGRADVELPSYFEALTRTAGRTVQVTPVVGEDGGACALAASAVADGRFGVRAIGRSRGDQAFYWQVMAVRADVPELEVERSKETT